MVNEGLLALNDDLIERSSEEEKTPEGGEDGEEGEEEEEEEEDGKKRRKILNKRLSICQSVFIRRLLCVHQPKNACKYALQELVRLTKKKYNLKFENMFAMKQDKFDQINGKNNRIKEILGELKTEGKYFVPEWKDDEWPERFSKSSEEMPFERYVTEAERKRLAEEEEERKRREANQDEDNAPQRALNEMMGGTLEEKTEANAPKSSSSRRMDG